MDSTITTSVNLVKSESNSDRESEKSSLLSSKTSPGACDSETAKDSGTEKKKEEKDEEECNHDREEEHEDLGFDANSYQAETVDFPESPQHLKLLKQKTREAQGLGPDDDDLTQNLSRKDSVPSTDEQLSRQERPLSLSTVRKKKISVHPDILGSDNNDDDQRSISSVSNKSDADVMSPVEDFTGDDMDTPDDLDDSVLERTASDSIPELSAAEEMDGERNWQTCTVGGVERKIDVKVIEPYRKVMSHGGYYGTNRNAIIVFSACYLPDRSRRDYDYVMDNLFLYVLSTLDQLIADDYILVYLHGATQRSNMPGFGWLKRCYHMIDRRLRKNLKGLYLVHPTFWVKTIVIMTRPFISSKFSRKLQFVNNLKELSELIPMDHVCIPDKVKQFDEEKALEA
ncbi:protein prune homolog 2-like isoform X2 [Limulus polyphemus]|nr:protein prune homolog 2-like isoform X2 [Limulus polyphemus]